MIPTRINLLSNEKRDLLHKMVYMQFIKHMGQLTVLLLCFIAILLVSADNMLNGYLGSLHSNVSVSTTRISELNKKITDINKTISKVDLLQNRAISWSSLFSLVISQVPQDITLSTLQLKRDEKIFIFSGKAPSRESAQNFQRTLEKMDIVKSSSLPISQLTQKKDISFTITAKLK